MIKSKQLQVGNATEENVIKIFKKNHFWAYLTPRKIGGQPIDIISIRNKEGNTEAWLLDAKHVEQDKISFAFNRIEPNQWTAMEYASEWAGLNVDKMGFAIEFERNRSVYWLPYKTALEMVKNGQKSIKLYELKLLEEIL